MQNRRNYGSAQTVKKVGFWGKAPSDEGAVSEADWGRDRKMFV